MLDICIDHKGLQYIGGSAHGDETIRETLLYHMNSIAGAMPCVNNPLPLSYLWVVLSIPHVGYGHPHIIETTNNSNNHEHFNATCMSRFCRTCEQ
jgi:hypothetical protein